MDITPGLSIGNVQSIESGVALVPKDEEGDNNTGSFLKINQLKKVVNLLRGIYH